jgi:hypothetical protein
MKINILRVIRNLIFVAVFNAVFFTLGGFEHNASVWISYGFIHFAYFMFLMSPMMIRRGKSAGVFAPPLFLISFYYFVIVFIAGLVFILMAYDNYKVVLVVQLVIASIYGVILALNLIANEHTANAEEKRQYEIYYVKDASVKLKGLLENINDKDAKKKVEAVYDAIYSSPVKSHPNLAQIENCIIQSINELDDAISSGNKENIISLSKSLLSAVNERNMRLKTLN